MRSFHIECSLKVDSTCHQITNSLELNINHSVPKKLNLTTASTWLSYVTILALASRVRATRQESRQNASQVKQMLERTLRAEERKKNKNTFIGFEKIAIRRGSIKKKVLLGQKSERSCCRKEMLKYQFQVNQKKYYLTRNWDDRVAGNKS